MPYSTEQYVEAIKAAELAGDESAARRLTQAMAESLGARGAMEEGRGMAATIGQGMTLGTLDELAGIVGGPGATQGMRQDVAAFRQQNPMMAAGLEVAGAIPTGIGIGAGIGRMAQLGGRAGQAGKFLAAPNVLPQSMIGAGEGAAYGAGIAEAPGERLTGGLLGAGLGALGGAFAVPTSRALLRRFAPGVQAENMVAANLRQDLGRTPTAADFDELRYRAGEQPQRTLAEVVGPATENLARTSAKMPAGGARALAQRTLDTRRTGATNRLIRSLQESTGSREDYWRNIRNLEAKAKTDAKPLYDAARDAPFLPDEELIDLADRGVDTGEIKAGYEAARRQARLREGKKIPTWRELTGEDGPGLENLDLETWDWIKRGLDARYKKVVRQDPAMASAIWAYRQQLVAKLDEMVPEYRQARRSYAGPMEQREAQQAGRNIFREDAEFTEEFVAELSQGEKDAYITGAVQSIKDKLKAVPVEGGMPRFTQLGFDRLRSAFPSDEAADVFLSQVLQEREMQKFRNMILAGSPTAEIMAAQEHAGRTMGAAGGVGQILTGQPVEGARTIATNLLPKRAATIPARINDPLSQMLFSQGMGIPPVLQRLQQPAIMPNLLAPSVTAAKAILANQPQRGR